jgi:hypothetical protein
MITTRQIEITAKPFVITEYHRHSHWHPACQTYHTAPVPEQGRCHVSFSALKDFFREVLGIRVSRGFLSKQIMKVSGSLKETHRQLGSVAVGGETSKHRRERVERKGVKAVDMGILGGEIYGMHHTGQPRGDGTGRNAGCRLWEYNHE